MLYSSQWRGIVTVTAGMVVERYRNMRLLAEIKKLTASVTPSPEALMEARAIIAYAYDWKRGLAAPLSEAQREKRNANEAERIKRREAKAVETEARRKALIEEYERDGGVAIDSEEPRKCRVIKRGTCFYGDVGNATDMTRTKVTVVFQDGRHVTLPLQYVFFLK